MSNAPTPGRNRRASSIGRAEIERLTAEIRRLEAMKGRLTAENDRSQTENARLRAQIDQQRHILEEQGLQMTRRTPLNRRKAITHVRHPSRSPLNEIDLTMHDRQTLNGEPNAYEQFLQFIADEERMQPAQLPFAAPDESCVQQLWHAINTQFKDLPSGDHPEKTDDFPRLIARMMECIWTYLHINHFAAVIRPAMSEKKTPDLVVCAQGITQPDFSDVVIVMATKLPGTTQFTDAVIEAFDCYLFALAALPRADASHPYRFGVCTDYRSIAVIANNNTDDPFESAFQYTDVLALFPVGWRGMDAPTDGFRWLCHLLSAPQRFPGELRLGGKQFSIVKTVSVRTHASYIVQAQDESKARYAVKMVRDTSNESDRADLKNEWLRLKTVSELPGMQPYMIMPDAALTDAERGVLVFPCGQVLTDWYRAHDTATRDAELIRHIRHICEGLKHLHDHKWYHSDIRPGNLVVLAGTARLIDWAAAYPECDATFRYISHPGQHDPYLPDQVYYGHRQRFREYRPVWDYLCLAYSVFGVLGVFDRFDFLGDAEFTSLTGMATVRQRKLDAVRATCDSLPNRKAFRFAFDLYDLAVRQPCDTLSDAGYRNFYRALFARHETECVQQVVIE